MIETCIVIGAGYAASQLAVSVRQHGWRGRILVIGDEPFYPYQRPSLSKNFLEGKEGREDILIRPVVDYEKYQIEFRLGTRVEMIDRAYKSVVLQSGEVLHYDKLALCTGSRVRRVTIPGANLDGIHYLRHIRDAEHIQARAKKRCRAVIVGGGYLGLETAAALKTMGMEVIVLEMAPRILARVTAHQISEFFVRTHTRHGVIIKTGMAVTAFEGGKGVSHVVCANGSRFRADVIIIGVGVVPNVELAEAAGLKVCDGIEVDQYAITSDPDVVAAGDCTSHPNSFYQRSLRLESVPNAIAQAKSAAASICGKRQPHNSLPWFWSEQYDVKLQIAGLNQDYDQVVLRGDESGGRDFSVFYLKNNRLIAADCINRPGEFMISKRLITRQIEVDKTLLSNENIAVKSLLPIG